jgi:hypothetical protein
MEPEPVGAGPERHEANRALRAVILGSLLGIALWVFARRRS